MAPIVVSAAVIEVDERFLITRRPKGTHLEGYWEFPGGKCLEGESLAACLERELHEELATASRVREEVFTTTHAYPDREIELHFLRCDLTGEPRPQQQQEMRWVTRAELAKLTFPLADTELIRLLVER